MTLDSGTEGIPTVKNPEDAGIELDAVSVITAHTQDAYFMESPTGNDPEQTKS